VTKVDERAHVPPLDEAACRRLAAALDREGVVSASLFGSQATGMAGPLSDVDVAVWLDPALSSDERFNLRLRLMTAASRAIGSDEVDVVPLNDAPPLLRQRAIRDGRRLVERDARQRVRLDTAAILEYLDTAPLRRAIEAGLRRRLAEGTFGRR
jgi:predicted nucleotidyltransferase